MDTQTVNPLGGELRPTGAARVRLLLVALLAVPLVLALAARAEAVIYYSTGTSIGRADLDNGARSSTFITGLSAPTTAVAVNDTHIFWTRGTSVNPVGAIGRANIDGTGANATFISPLTLPQSLAVHGDYIYYGQSGGVNKIGRVKTDGTEMNNDFITTTGAPAGIAVNGSHVYWTNAGVGSTIGRADIDGSNVNNAFISGAPAVNNAQGIAVNATHVFWTNAGGTVATNTIARADLDGANANGSFFASQFSPRGITLDSSFIYWANSGAYGRATLDGVTRNQTFITGTTGAQGIAVDPLRASNNAVACVPNNPAATKTTTCTATVTDIDGGTTVDPGGVVNWMITGGTIPFDSGTYPDGTSCTLALISPNTARCSIRYIPSQAGLANFRGRYVSNTGHATSTNVALLQIGAPPRTTATTLVCNPDTLPATTQTTCTATVTDTAAGTPIDPTGSVSFSTTGGGAFSPATSCTLASAGAGVSSCQITYTPNAAGGETLTAAHVGDANHGDSNGQATLSVGPPPPPTSTDVSCTPSQLPATRTTHCTVTVTDTSAAPISPAGSVSLSSDGAGAFQPAPSCTLAAAGPDSASCEVDYVPSAQGTQTLTATYAGVPPHLGSNDTTSLDVGPAPSPTSSSVACSPNPVVATTPATCTVTVTDTGGSPTSPSGTVDFSATGGGSFSPDDSCTLAPAGPDSSSCQVSHTPTSAGDKTIGVSYGATAAHESSSGQTTLAVDPFLNATSTDISCTPSQLPATRTTTCTVTVTDTGAGPTSPAGSVSLSSDGAGAFQPAPSCTLAAAGPDSASCQASYVPSAQGTQTLTATYASVVPHQGSNDTTALDVGPAPSSTSSSVVCAPNPVMATTPSTCTVTVTDTGGSPTSPSGTVDFSATGGGSFSPDDSCTLAPAGSDSSSCQVSHTPTSGGDKTIGVSYGATAAHESSSGQTTLGVTPASNPTSSAVVCAPSPVPATTPSTCTATVTDTGSSPSSPTGTVTFSTSPGGSFSPADSCTLAPAGANRSSCQLSYTPTTTGNKTIGVSYGGSAAHDPSSGQVTLGVTAAPRPTTTEVTCTPEPVPATRQATCVVTVQDTTANPTNPIGLVNASADGSGAFQPGPSCTLAPIGGGASRCQVVYVPSVPGSQTLTASYAGAGAHVPSSDQTTITVGPVPHPTSTTVTCDPPNIAATRTTSCTVTVTDTSPSSPTVPTGSVSWAATGGGTFTPPSCTLEPISAVASRCVSGYRPSTPGTKTVRPTYVATPDHNTSTAQVTVIAGPVPGPSSTEMVCDRTSVVATKQVTCTATVTDTAASNQTTPAGEVEFTSTGSGAFDPARCTLTETTPGVATCSSVHMPIGTGHQTITGTYLGTDDHATTFAEQKLLVGNPPPHEAVLQLACSPQSVPATTATTCTATASDSDATVGLPPEGTVEFATEGTGAFSSGSCALEQVSDSLSRCAVSYTPSAVGTQMLTATYAGSEDHGGDSGVETLVVQSAPVQPPPPEEPQPPVVAPKPGNPLPDPPANGFMVGETKLARKKGTATIQIEVPGKGQLVLSGTGVKRVVKRTAGKGNVKLVVKATGKSLKTLRRKGKLKVSFRVAFTPDGGSAKTRRLSVTLKLDKAGKRNRR